MSDPKALLSPVAIALDVWRAEKIHYVSKKCGMVIRTMNFFVFKNYLRVAICNPIIQAIVAIMDTIELRDISDIIAGDRKAP